MTLPTNLARRRLFIGSLPLLALPPLLLRPSAAWAAAAGRETRPVADFVAIALSGPIDLQVRQGAKEALELVGDADLLARVETVIESGRHGRTLHIRLRGMGSRTGSIKAVVDVVRLQALALAGSGTAAVAALQTPQFDVALSGAGDLLLEQLKTDKLALSVSGSGDVRGSGSAARAALRMAGSGDIDLRQLPADEMSISIAGSGDANVTANKQLKVSIAGSGDVRYGGAVADVSSSVAGSGSVRRRSE